MATAYDTRQAFEDIELELIRSMQRNLAGHRDWELDEGFDWPMWQAEQLQSMHQWQTKYAKLLPEQYVRINQEAETLIRSMSETGAHNQEQEILSAVARGYEPPVSQTPNFFKINQPKLDALVSETMQPLRTAETAILRTTNDQYRRIIYNAQVYANTGAGSLRQAVDMASKDFLSQGINCVEYKNGHRVNIASYSEMAIRTANKRAYLEAEGERRKEYGISLVEIMPNSAACKKCLPWLGKVLIDDVWSGGKPDG